MSNLTSTDFSNNLIEFHNSQAKIIHSELRNLMKNFKDNFELDIDSISISFLYGLPYFDIILSGNALSYEKVFELDIDSLCYKTVSVSSAITSEVFELGNPCLNEFIRLRDITNFFSDTVDGIFDDVILRIDDNIS